MIDLFGKKTTSVIIATNPITYILLLMVCLYIPFYFLWRLLKLHDVWFVIFKISKLSKGELYTLEGALKKRMEKRQRHIWYKYINKMALRKIEKAIQQLK